MKMKTRLENIYKDLINGSQINPPQELWEDISRELDVNDVWGNISRDLDTNLVVRLENYTMAVSVAAFFLSLFFLLRPANIEISNAPTLSQVEILSGNTEVEAKNPAIERSPIGVPVETREVDDLSDPVMNINSQSMELDDITLQREITNEGSNHSQVFVMNLERRGYSISRDLQLTTPFYGIEIANSENQNITSEGRVFIGIVGSLKNTWLVNDKTISGFSAQELHTTKAILGREFGLFAGIKISSKQSLLAEYLFTSNYAQNYQEYLGGHYITSSINVDYSKLNLLFALRVSREGNWRTSTELLLGPSLGILKSATESIEGDEVTLTDNYENFLFGLTGGIQKYLFLNPKLEVFGGIRLSYGITNIYKGTGVIPASFRITHPAAISFSFGLRYNLPKK